MIRAARRCNRSRRGCLSRRLRFPAVASRALRTAVSPVLHSLRCRPSIVPCAATSSRDASHEQASTSSSSFDDDDDELEQLALPFAVGDEFLSEVREYLIEEEGIDPNDEELLRAAMFEMAHEMCEMAMEEGEGDLDEEIYEELAAGAAPFAEIQERWEERMRAQGKEVPDLSVDITGFGTGGVPVPDNVSPEALQQFLDWEAETSESRDPVLGSMGWNPDEGGLHPAVATSILGVQGWRLGPQIHPQLAILASNIEAFWRQLFPNDLVATDMDPRWKLVDSADCNQAGMAWDRADPAPGAVGYPRLVLENRCYQTSAFRNLHLEVAVRQDGFQVLHCVMWPRREYELPILGVDLVVGTAGKLQYFICDASPVTADRALPPVYVDAVRMLRAQFMGGFPDAAVPEWAGQIMSGEVAAARPAHVVEGDLCIMYALALMRAHILFAKRAAPLSDAAALERVDAAHRRYCELQRSNAKTTAVLNKAFEHLGPAGEMLVERYMFEVLFDHEFHYDISEETKEALKNSNPGLGQPATDPRVAAAAAEFADVARSTMKRGMQEAEAEKSSQTQSQAGD